MGIVLAAAEAAAKKPGSSSTTLLLLIVLVFAGFYFLMIRPQRRRQQQARQQQGTATPGARVRTIGGMFATVSAVDGDDVILEVAPGVEVRYMKRAIAEVIAPGEAEAEETVADDEPGYADDDVSDEHDAGVTDHAESAEEGLTDSHHDKLASSDKDNVF
jgi:preprotein translocase subunit YajC